MDRRARALLRVREDLSSTILLAQEDEDGLEELSRRKAVRCSVGCGQLGWKEGEQQRRCARGQTVRSQQVPELGGKS